MSSRPPATIRPATRHEVEAVLDMYEWLFAPPGSVPPGWDRERAAARLLAAMEREDCAVLVAESPDNRLIGLCSAYIDLDSVRFGRRCWVEDLAVDPGERSRGVGAALLAEARRWAAARGATHLELDTGEARADAQRFYERERPAWRSISYAWVLEGD